MACGLAATSAAPSGTRVTVGGGCKRYRPLEENPRYNLESTGSLPEPSGASLEMALIFFGSGDCPPGPERLPVLED